MKTVFVKCGPNESTAIVIKSVVGSESEFVKEVSITDLLPSEKQIGNCLQVGDSKQTIVNRICDLIGINRERGTQTCHSTKDN